MMLVGLSMSRVQTFTQENNMFGHNYQCTVPWLYVKSRTSESFLCIHVAP